MAAWLEEAWSDIEALTVDLDQAQRDLATSEAYAAKRRRLDSDIFGGWS